MKLNKIAALCKRSKTIEILDEEQTDGTVVQWAGDGKAMYALQGMPVFTPETLFTALGFEMEEKSCWLLNQKQMTIFDMSPAFDTDGEASFDQVGRIEYKGMPLTIAYCEGKTYFFNERYFGPLRLDANFNAHMRKTPAGVPYMVTSDGMFTTAIIAPVETGEEFRNWIKGIIE